MRFCNMCREYHGDTCPPEWVCRILGEDDSDHTVKAYNAEDAAEKYAEHYDETNEFPLLKGGLLIVEICRGAECVRFHVEGEAVPRYYARPATPN